MRRLRCLLSLALADSLPIAVPVCAPFMRPISNLQSQSACCWSVLPSAAAALRWCQKMALVLLAGAGYVIGLSRGRGRGGAEAADSACPICLHTLKNPVSDAVPRCRASRLTMP